MSLALVTRLLKECKIEGKPKTIKDGWVRLEKFAAQQAKNEEERKIRELTKEALKSKDDYIQTLAEAVLLDRFNKEPVINKRKEIGYNLANWVVEEKTKKNPLYNQLITIINVIDFVFNHTHYDEYSSGHFFRRS